jgi:hypothetical protein
LGSYSTKPGAANCSQCTAGTYSETIGSSSQDDCLDCAAQAGSSLYSACETINTSQAIDLVVSNLYDIVFSFQLNANVDIPMRHKIRNTIAEQLNINVEMVGLLQMKETTNVVRRLLSIYASFTISSTSQYASQKAELFLSVEQLNAVLHAASNGTLTATALVVSRGYEPKQENKHKQPEHNLFVSDLMSLFAVVFGLILVISFVYFVVQKTKRVNFAQQNTKSSDSHLWTKIYMPKH